MAYLDDKILASNASLTGNLSYVVDLDYATGYAIQTTWTGSPTGTLKLQASNDLTNWTDISGATQSLSGSSGNALFNQSGTYYRYVQLVYTFSSGSGSLTATCTAKGY